MIALAFLKTAGAWFLRVFSPYLLPALLCVGAVAWAYQAGARSQSEKFARERAELVEQANRAVMRAVERADAEALRYEDLKAQRARKATTIIKEIVREVEKPVYRECAVPADGVRLLNAARAGEPVGSGDPASALPAGPDAP